MFHSVARARSEADEANLAHGAIGNETFCVHQVFLLQFIPVHAKTQLKEHGTIGPIVIVSSDGKARYAMHEGKPLSALTLCCKWEASMCLQFAS